MVRNEFQRLLRDISAAPLCLLLTLSYKVAHKYLLSFVLFVNLHQKPLAFP